MGGSTTLLALGSGPAKTDLDFFFFFFFISRGGWTTPHGNVSTPNQSRVTPILAKEVAENWATPYFFIFLLIFKDF
jgi:hypothetical protein